MYFGHPTYGHWQPSFAFSFSLILYKILRKHKIWDPTSFIRGKRRKNNYITKTCGHCTSHKKYTLISICRKWGARKANRAPKICSCRYLEGNIRMRWSFGKCQLVTLLSLDGIWTPEKNLVCPVHLVKSYFISFFVSPHQAYRWFQLFPSWSDKGCNINQYQKTRESSFLFPLCIALHGLEKGV